MKTSRYAILVFCSALLSGTQWVQAALYSGNGNTGFGGAVGQGSLALTDNGTSISGTFTRGGGNFNDNLVIYIDSVTGGFNSTSGFNDQDDALRRSISGVSGSGRSTATFVSGFNADYAIALGANGPNFGGLWQLANGDNNSLIYKTSVGLNPNNSNSSATYTFSFNWSDIGLTGGSGVSFTFESTYLAGDGYRSTETFEDLTGTQGWNPFTFTSLDTFSAVPEPVTTSLVLFGAGFGVCGLRRYFSRLARTH